MDGQERAIYSGYLALQTRARAHTHTPKWQNVEIRDFLEQTPDQILNNSLIQFSHSWGGLTEMYFLEGPCSTGGDYYCYFVHFHLVISI